MISTLKVNDLRLAAVVEECATAEIPVTHAFMTFRRLQPTEFGGVLPEPQLAALNVPVPAESDLTLLNPVRRPTTVH